MRKFKYTLLLLAVASLALVARGYWNATRDPIVRTAALKIADWPENAPPVKVLLISDIHMTAPDLPPERMSRLIDDFNALSPDLVLIAGDFYSGKRFATRRYSAAEIVAPLKRFKARYGVITVLGNHDIWHDEAGFKRELRKAGLTLLENDAAQRGPLVVGGVGDEFTNNDDVPKTLTAMQALPGAPIILTHSPDIVPKLSSRVAAVLAGHTHCGQANLPWSGASINSSSRYGLRFQCGDLTDKGQRVFVTAGLGTSVIWLRYGAPPDAWLVTVGL
jgi:predicted MPP superfamily phosphohydrolase